jgi:hypothetical protein
MGSKGSILQGIVPFYAGILLSGRKLSPERGRKMKYEKPQLLTSCTFADIRAAEKCGCTVLEGGPPFLYVMSPNVYEADE